MKNKQRITRNALVQTVAGSLPRTAANDLPMIRQALNDTADSYRKDGYEVGDYDQDRMVKMVQDSFR